LARGLPPEELTEHFFSVKEKIVSSFKEKKAPEAKKAKVKRMKRKARKAAKPKSKPKRRVSKEKKGEVKK